MEPESNGSKFFEVLKQLIKWIQTEQVRNWFSKFSRLKALKAENKTMTSTSSKPTWNCLDTWHSKRRLLFLSQDSSKWTTVSRLTSRDVKPLTIVNSVRHLTVDSEDTQPQDLSISNLCSLHRTFTVLPKAKRLTVNTTLCPPALPGQETFRCACNEHTGAHRTRAATLWEEQKEPAKPKVLLETLE